MKKSYLFLSVLFTLALFIAACSSSDNHTHEEEAEATETVAETTEAVEEAAQNIVEIAVGNEDFSTLVAAVQAAELVETLSGAGPFTVFAPVNTAFEKLPAGTVEGLLKPESKDALTGVLTYHVVSGEYKAADVIAAIEQNNGSFEIPTVQGGKIVASIDGESVILTDENGGVSTVVLTDVAASNGVIHAIDAVVLPK